MRTMLMIVAAPVLYFREVVEDEPRWGRALAPVIIAAGLAGLATCVTAVGIVRNMPAMVIVLIFLMDALGAMLAFFVYGSLFGFVDALVMTSGRILRVIECVALAFWVKVGWGVCAVLFAGSYDRGPAVSYAELGGAMDAVFAIADGMHIDMGDTMLVVYDHVAMYSSLWIVALGSCVLYAVSGMSIRGSAVVGVVVGLVFVVGPWVLGRAI